MWNKNVFGHCHSDLVARLKYACAVALLLFAPAIIYAAPFIADDFNSSSLNPTIWEVTDPRGDSSISVNGTQLVIDVPAGISHDVWTDGNHAPRVLQRIDNTDFEIVAKFDSTMSQMYQMQGILVEQDNTNLLRFDFHHDGSRFYIFAASFSNGMPAVIHHGTIVDAAVPLFMRVKRSGDQWVLDYSVPGSNWTTAVQFSQPLLVTKVGPFVGNAGFNPPAFRGLIDYVLNTGSQTSEEPDPVPDTTAPVISNVSIVPGSTHIQVTWSTDESATGSVQYGETPAYEFPAVNEAGAGLQHNVLLSGLKPETTYFLRVVSQDSSGNVAASQGFEVRTLTSGPSAPEITVWYGQSQRFGHLGNPQRWVNVLGKVSDPDGIQSLSYSLNGQPQRPLAMGPGWFRLQSDGDFNIDILYSDLLPGSNSIVIAAIDNLGHMTSRTVTVNNSTGNSWSRPYIINWANTAKIEDVAQIVDGLWTIEGVSARSVEPGYDRLIAIGELSWKDYEVTVPITVHSLVEGYPDGGPGVGVLMRWSGHYEWSDSHQPHIGWFPLGALGWYRWTPDMGEFLNILANEGELIAVETTGRRLALNVRHIFKMRVETLPGQGSRYSLKVWQAGQPEPASWDLTGITQDVYPESRSGSLLLLSHHVNASFGNVTIIPLESN